MIMGKSFSVAVRRASTIRRPSPCQGNR
jgi:hypothetical protein